MRVLAIDSSGLTATVAIVDETETIAEYTINYKKTHSQTLLPMIDEMVKMTETDLNTIDAIAVAGRTGFIYRASDRFRNGERTGTCAGETADPCADGGWTCVQCIWL